LVKNNITNWVDEIAGRIFYLFLAKRESAFNLPPQ
jgi:hypothetical protein